MQNTFTSNVQNDHVLIEALKERQPEALNSFYEKYAALFYGNIKKTLFKDDVSEETLRGVFKTIVYSIEEFDPNEERFFTWALKIAHKEIRKQKVQIVLNEVFAQ